MWILLLLLVLVLCYVYRIEGFESMSPYEMVQEQAGTIQQLHGKITKITLSEAYLTVLEQENDDTTDKINQLQENMPPKEVKEAYP